MRVLAIYLPTCDPNDFFRSQSGNDTCSWDWWLVLLGSGPSQVPYSVIKVVGSLALCKQTCLHLSPTPGVLSTSHAQFREGQDRSYEGRIVGT